MPGDKLMALPQELLILGAAVKTGRQIVTAVCTCPA